jgi:hypothetical protein
MTRVGLFIYELCFPGGGKEGQEEEEERVAGWYVSRLCLGGVVCI